MTISYDLTAEIVSQTMDGHLPPVPSGNWPVSRSDFREQIEALSEETWQEIEACEGYRRILFTRLEKEYGEEQFLAWLVIGSLPPDLHKLDRALQPLIPMADEMPEGHRLRKIFGRHGNART